MLNLLTDYLENNEIYNYNGVNILNFNENGHICEVRFRHDESSHEVNKNLNIWDVLSFIYNKKL